jgi:hypothetical protein
MDALDGDACGRIGLEHGRNGGAQQAANGFQPIDLARRAVDLGEHEADMFWPEQSHALHAMAGAKGFDGVAAIPLGIRCEALPLGGLVVADHERVDRARHGAVGADLARRARQE